MAGIKDGDHLSQQEETFRCPACDEEVEKEEDGTLPKFCDDCGAGLHGPKPLTKCPKCNKDRKKKKGQYVKNCSSCGLKYAEAESARMALSSDAGKLTLKWSPIQPGRI